MNEKEKYEIIKRLVDEKGNKDRAAMTLGITRRQINRLIKKYKEAGKGAFVHGNRGRKSARAIPEEKRQLIVALYRTKYYDANFAHFTENLARKENIVVSESVVRSMLKKLISLYPFLTKEL